MKNAFCTIFAWCLISNTTNTMITYNQSNSDADYYNLQCMPEDVLKEIAIQASGTFSLEDLKTAKYYKECLANNRTLSKAGIATFDATSTYANVVQNLSVVNKQLYETLTDSRAQLNAMPKEKALLKLDYFNTFCIQLPSLEHSYFKNDGRKRDCSLSGRITVSPKNKALDLTIKCELYYHTSEYQELALPKLIELLKKNKSLGSCLILLHSIYKEVLNQSIADIKKYADALIYFKVITKAEGSSYQMPFYGLSMNSVFSVDAISSKFGQKNELVIPYALVKSLITDTE